MHVYCMGNKNIEPIKFFFSTKFYWSFNFKVAYSETSLKEEVSRLKSELNQHFMWGVVGIIHKVKKQWIYTNSLLCASVLWFHIFISSKDI